MTRKTIHSAAIMEHDLEEKREEWDIACFPNLTYLGKVGDVYDTRVFGYLKNLTALTGYISDTRAEDLPLEQLEIVAMNYSSIEPELWEEGGVYCEALKKMTNLKELYFCFDQEKAELPAVIGTKTDLRALTLENIGNVGTLKVIAPLKHLKRLTLESGSQLKSLEFLKNYPELEALSLEIPKIKDLGPLCNCRKLKELFLDCNSRFQSMEPVSRLPKLESFEAVMYDIPGFEQLVKCRKLKNFLFLPMVRSHWILSPGYPRWNSLRFQTVTSRMDCVCCIRSGILSRLRSIRRTHWWIMRNL